MLVRLFLLQKIDAEDSVVVIVQLANVLNEGCLRQILIACQLDIVGQGPLLPENRYRPTEHQI